MFKGQWLDSLGNEAGWLDFCEALTLDIFMPFYCILGHFMTF